MAEKGLILLYWNHNSLKWVSSEDFSVNGGSTLGKQWFFIPQGFEHVGGNTFQEVRKYFIKGIDVHTLLEPVKSDLKTSEIGQMPYIETDAIDMAGKVISWFIPCPHARMARK